MQFDPGEIDFGPTATCFVAFFMRKGVFSQPAGHIGVGAVMP